MFAVTGLCDAKDSSILRKKAERQSLYVHDKPDASYLFAYNKSSFDK